MKLEQPQYIEKALIEEIRSLIQEIDVVQKERRSPEVEDLCNKLENKLQDYAALRMTNKKPRLSIIAETGENITMWKR